MIDFSIRIISEIGHILGNVVRLAWYNGTCFMWYRSLPLSTTIYGKLRLLHRPCRLSMGPRGRLGDGVYLATSLRSTIHIGSNVTINVGCVLVAVDSISIGDNTAIAEYVSIRDQEHLHCETTGVRDMGFHVDKVTIGSNVWIGRGVYIGPGASIGDSSIVAANSVVRGHFPPGVLLAGAPATIKKYLYEVSEDG